MLYNYMLFTLTLDCFYCQVAISTTYTVTVMHNGPFRLAVSVACLTLHDQAEVNYVGIILRVLGCCSIHIRLYGAGLCRLSPYGRMKAASMNNYILKQSHYHA